MGLFIDDDVVQGWGFTDTSWDTTIYRINLFLREEGFAEVSTESEAVEWASRSWELLRRRYFFGYETPRRFVQALHDSSERNIFKRGTLRFCRGGKYYPPFYAVYKHWGEGAYGKWGEAPLVDHICKKSRLTK